MTDLQIIVNLLRDKQGRTKQTTETLAGITTTTDYRYHSSDRLETVVVNGAKNTTYDTCG